MAMSATSEDRIKVLHDRAVAQLHLVLGSPAQLRAAIERKDKIVEALGGGEVLHDDRSEEAAELKRALGL